MCSQRRERTLSHYTFTFSLTRYGPFVIVAMVTLAQSWLRSMMDWMIGTWAHLHAFFTCLMFQSTLNQNVGWLDVVVAQNAHGMLSRLAINATAIKRCRSTVFAAEWSTRVTVITLVPCSESPIKDTAYNFQLGKVADRRPGSIT